MNRIKKFLASLLAFVMTLASLGVTNAFAVDVVSISASEKTTNVYKYAKSNGLDKFEPSMYIFTATYSDGSTATIDSNLITFDTDEMDNVLAYDDKLTANKSDVTCNVYAEYGGCKTSIPVTLTYGLSKISLKYPPDKLKYVEGDNLETDGMVLTYFNNYGAFADTQVEFFKNKFMNLTLNNHSYHCQVICEIPNLTVESLGYKEFVVTSSSMSTSTVVNQNTVPVVEGQKIITLRTVAVPIELIDYDSEIMVDATDSYYSEKTGIYWGKASSNSFLYMWSDDIYISSVDALEVTGITVTTQPTKTAYIAGQNFDKSGMIVTATYNNGSTATITDYAIDETQLQNGQSNVYVTYGNYFTTVPISVVAKEISSIEVTEQPDKTFYVEGEVFNPAGMVITATYTDGSKEDLASTEYSYSESALQAGTSSMTISAGDKTASVPITVVEKEITAISVTKSPDKISYITGQSVDPTGMIVTATFNDGSTAVISDYSYSPNVVNDDTTEITVSKDGKTAATPIIVTEKGVVSLEITSDPDKTEYTAGEAFDTTGMTVVAHYNDCSTSVINNYTVNTTPLAAGQTKVYITYDNLFATVDITVNEQEAPVTLTGIKVTEQPDKVSYIAGQTFDKSGMVVKAVYSDGSEQEITDYVVTNAPLSEGTTTVYVTYENYFATVSISVAAKEIVSIEVTNAPTQITYVEGQLFNPAGMVITATYTDGSKEDLALTEYSYSPFVALTTDDTIITISAGDKTATTPISVVKKEIVKIEVTKNPDKMTYVVGQTFNPDGMIVEAYYNDGTSAEIFDYIYQPEIITGTNSVRGDVNGDGSIDNVDAALVLRYISGTTVTDKFDTTAADCDGLPVISVLDANWILRYVAGQESVDTGFTGKEDVVISKDGASDTITVNVVEKAIISLEVIKYPDKTDYLAGQEFDPTGMIVEATYNDGSTTVITDYKVDTNKLSSDTTEVYVTCDGVYTTVPVIVKDSDVVKIEIIKEPVKTEYVEGESFDDTGMIVQVTYEDGTTEIIIDYKVNPSGSLTTDDDNVTISYGDVETTVPVTVVNKVVTGIEITKLPDKLEYEEGEVFDPAGMEVTATYNDGSTAVISDYTYNTDPFVAGDTSVTIEYKGYTDDVSIVLSMAGLEAFVPERNGDLNRDGNVTPEDAMILTKILGSVAYGYKAVHTGDVDGDEILTSDDVTLIKNYFNGNVSLSDESLINADIDGDGEVTEYDAILVNKATLGMWSLDTIYKLNADANDDGKINMLDVIWILNAYYKHTTIDHIEIITPPEKVNYVEGQTFDKSGMVVEAIYKDGTREELTDYSYPVRPLEMNDTSVIISFDSHEAEQPITVYKKAIIGSDDDKYPTTETSTEVTTSDGTEVTTGDEGSETTTSDSDVSTEITTSSDGSTEATTTEDSTETTTEENNGNSAGVKIISLPTKRVYVEGEVFDPEGLVIEISYNDGSKEYIKSSDVTVDKTPFKLDDIYGVIYYEYNDLTEKINVPITVIKKEISSVEITKQPDKTEYDEGEPFDKTGTEAEITYNDGTKETVYADDITVVDDKPLTTDDDSVTVIVGGIKVEIPIIVRPVTTTEITTETTTEVTTEDSTETTTRRPSSGGGAGGGLVVSTTEATTETATDEVNTEENTEATSENEDNRFEDVIDHWAEEYIEYLHKNGIVQGVTNKLFMPDLSTKRGDFAIVLDRLLNLEQGYMTFEDVSHSSYYAHAIANCASCASAGIFIGYGDGTFKPEQTITREEMMVIMAKVFAGTDYNFNSVDTSSLTDYIDGESVSWWAKPYVAYLVNNSTVVGDNGRIKPQTMITRAEMAVVIYNYLNK